MVRALTGSAALFAIGHGLDDWAVSLAQELGVLEAIVVDGDITLRSDASTTHQHGHATHGVDPHYWLALANAVHMVQHIAMALGRIDQARQDMYAQRARLYTAQLHQLNQDIRQRLARCQQRDLALFHPAFGYFAAAYDLHIVATFEPAPGREPTHARSKAFYNKYGLITCLSFL
jgi:zinc transport system substrate-binding protein